MSQKYIFTSESVTEGHPDKVADQVSDAVLDANLALDSTARVACETLVTTDTVVIAGEITNKSKEAINYESIVRQVIRNIGYVGGDMGFDAETFRFYNLLHKQSPDIAMGVDTGGAGDQGIMFGYASNETAELMPLPISLAQKLAIRLSEVRKKNIIKGLRPDGKTQVSVVYENSRPAAVDAVVVAAQHAPEVGQAKLRKEITEKVIKPVLGPVFFKSLSPKSIYINQTGRFEIGGPHGDTGLTGRKIIVDSYGGRGRHGGGAFSGKDPTKVDRSATYMARYVAKNIVAAGLAAECEVQLSYVIGRAEPVSVLVNTFGSAKISEVKIGELITKNFDLTPKAIINFLKLRKPIFSKTAAYGHFGRKYEKKGGLEYFTWEKTDMAVKLRKQAGI